MAKNMIRLSLCALSVVLISTGFAGCNGSKTSNTHPVQPRANFMALDPAFVSSQSLYLVREQNIAPAWLYGTGKGVTVGLIDTGRIVHEDLDGAYAEGGYDFIRERAGCFVTEDEVSDTLALGGLPYNHANACDSLLAARGNNGKGMCGVAPDAKILPIVALTEDGYGTDMGLTASVNYARGKKVRVLSMSWGFDSKGPGILEATYRAAQEGMILVAAAGNDATEVPIKNRAPGLFPANYPWVISVGATERDAVGDTFEVNRASFSNYGDAVDIYCRGRSVTVAQGYTLELFDPIEFFGEIFFSDARLKFGSQYVDGDGTSFAAPQVAGIIAVALEIKPDLTTDTIRSLMQATADDLPPHGRKLLNMGRFLQAVAALGPGNAPVTIPNTTQPPTNETVPPRPPTPFTYGDVMSDLASILSIQARVERQQEQQDVTKRLRVANWPNRRYHHR